MKKILIFISGAVITSSCMNGLLNINNTNIINYSENDKVVPPNMTTFSYINFGATAELPMSNDPSSEFANESTSMVVAQKYNYVSVRMSGMVKFGYWHEQSPRFIEFGLDKLFQSGSTMTQNIFTNSVQEQYEGKLSVVGTMIGTNQYNLQIKVQIKKITGYVIDGYSTLKINTISFYS